MEILVVCGAWASSTFVARRLRTAAAAAGLDWSPRAVSRHELGADADVVLVGPHLAEQMSAISAASHAAVVLLPADIFADLDGTRTLALVQAAIHIPAKGTS